MKRESALTSAMAALRAWRVRFRFGRVGVATVVTRISGGSGVGGCNDSSAGRWRVGAEWKREEWESGASASASVGNLVTRSVRPTLNISVRRIGWEGESSRAQSQRQRQRQRRNQFSQSDWSADVSCERSSLKLHSITQLALGLVLLPLLANP